MVLLRLTIPLLMATALIAAPAAAQRRERPSLPVAADWTHGSTVSMETGVATDSSATGPLIGGALGWEVVPRLMFEGSARWADRHGDTTGFNAALKDRAGLRRSDVSPFVEGGVGLYRLNAMTLSDAPSFYQGRGPNTTGVRQTFTDPSFHLGAGLNVFVSRRLAIQPAAEAMMVTRSSTSYTTGLFAIRAVYHFEDHPVTPSR